MTESSSSLNALSFFHPQSITASIISSSALPNGVPSDSNLQEEEEEYTIKCICIYNDDDGNTVYCEKCDTWQHILCYYHGKKVPDVHFCAECDNRDVRDLDAKKATERQRRAREHIEGNDRKVKRPSSKTSKKKQKDSIVQEYTNGWISHDRSDSVSNSRDQPPPAKKPKTSHRTSGSIVSLNGESRKRANSTLQSYPSPSKSPQDLYRFPPVPQYTSEFLELYDRDRGNTSAESNQYTIPGLDQMSKWKTDPSLVVNGMVEQPSNRSPFVRTQENLDQLPRPKISVETSTNTELEFNGKNPTWRFLRLGQAIAKDTPVGEICGQIGTLDEYCQHPSAPNRWTELAHPDPFVFFHPHMNIYIDSRETGTAFRFLRRSCQPNVTLKTFVGDGDGPARHFFVANQEIPAGSELTAAWFINNSSSIFDINSHREDSEHLESQRCEWASKILANFGDCACDNAQCPLGRLDRRSSLKPVDGQAKSSAGRKRKAKGKPAISPMSTGQATNSRAGSEVINGANEEDGDDRKSTSGSSRAGPGSRDATPINVAVLDADPVLTNLTARELRKLKNLESSFKIKEKKSSKEKKKRVSAGSTLNTPNPDHSKQSDSSPIDFEFGHQSTASLATSCKEKSAKVAKSSATPTRARPTYVSAAVQTDPDPEDLGDPTKPNKDLLAPWSFERYKPVSQVQRLLNRIAAEEQRELSKRKHDDLELWRTCPYMMFPSSGPAVPDPRYKDEIEAMYPNGIPRSYKELKEMFPDGGPSDMVEASTNPAAREDKPNMVGSTTYPLPSQAAHTQTRFKAPLAPRLHLSTLPPVPTFPNGAVVTPNSTVSTPTLATPSSTQSQHLSAMGLNTFPPTNSSIVTPSPVKKKLSLGDYMNRRNQATTPATEKTQAQASGEMLADRDLDAHRKSSNAGSDVPSEGATDTLRTGLADDDADMNLGDGIAIEDTDMKDDDEPEYSPPDASPAQADLPQSQSLPSEFATSTTGLSAGNLDPNVASVLAHLKQYQQPIDKV